LKLHNYLRNKMKRLELYKAKLKAARAELVIRQRQANSVQRALFNVTNRINDLEQKIENLAQSK
jgi:uncharacterized coiled-coil DUF342 family protein